MSLVYSRYLKYPKILNICSIYLKYHGSQTNKQNMIMTTYKELLGTWHPNLKKQNIYTVFTKSASKNPPNQPFLHMLLFNMSRKPFVACAATRSSQKEFRNKAVENKD